MVPPVVHLGFRPVRASDDEGDALPSDRGLREYAEGPEFERRPINDEWQQLQDREVAGEGFTVLAPDTLTDRPGPDLKDVSVGEVFAGVSMCGSRVHPHRLPTD